MSISTSILISKSRASSIGLGVIFISSTSLIIFLFCKWTQKIKKVKLFILKNKDYFYKSLFIFTIFYPEIIALGTFFFLNKIIYFFKFFMRFFFKLIRLDFLYLLGFFIFQTFLNPFFKLFFIILNRFLNILNFLKNIKLFNKFFILDAVFQLSILFWTSMGFLAGFSKNLSFYSRLDILILDFLTFLTATFLLIFTFIFDKNQAKIKIS